jgi:hypothetical protein
MQASKVSQSVSDKSFFVDAERLSKVVAAREWMTKWVAACLLCRRSRRLWRCGGKCHVVSAVLCLRELQPETLQQSARLGCGCHEDGAGMHAELLRQPARRRGGV